MAVEGRECFLTVCDQCAEDVIRRHISPKCERPCAQHAKPLAILCCMLHNWLVMNLILRTKIQFDKALGLIWLIFDVFSILASSTFLLCLFVQANSPRDLLRELSVCTKSFRQCDKCMVWKPPRAHHCRQCRRCILMYDHHCFWVGNCIGHGNLHFFIQYLSVTFFGAAYSIWLVYHHRQVALDYFSDERTPAARLRLLALVAVIDACVLFAIAGTACAWRLAHLMANLRRGLTAYEALLLRPPPRRGLRTTGPDLDSPRRAEAARELAAVLSAAGAHGSGPAVFLGRQWPLKLAAPMAGPHAGELLATALEWQAAVDGAGLSGSGHSGV